MVNSHSWELIIERSKGKTKKMKSVKKLPSIKGDGDCCVCGHVSFISIQLLFLFLHIQLSFITPTEVDLFYYLKIKNFLDISIKLF